MTKEMAHSKLYKKLIGCKQWRDLRNHYISTHLLCERCLQQDIYTAAQAVHHKIPVESGHNEQECRDLCYSESNLMSVCYRCHSEIHKLEIGSYKPEVHKQREQERLEQWIAKIEAKRSQ